MLLLSAGGRFASFKKKKKQITTEHPGKSDACTKAGGSWEVTWVESGLFHFPAMRPLYVCVCVYVCMCVCVCVCARAHMLSHV